MAAANKPTLVHFSLIFFVMLSIILGITTYTFYTGQADAVAAKAKADSEKRLADTVANNRRDEVTELKKVIGYDLETVVDNANRNNPQSVVGKMLDDIKTLGGAVAQPTYTATLQKLRQELDATIADRDQIKQNLEKEHTTLLALQKQYQGRTDDHDKARLKAETDLRGEIDKHASAMEAKNEEIAKLRTDFNEIQVKLDQEVDLHARDLRNRDEQIRRLNIINVSLNEELDKVKEVSFEVPDGKIVRVDNNTRLVWVGLGSDDFLKVRTTFSVYNKDNQGVGRGMEDVKAKIEVTRIVGPHMAEARILDEDLYRPIAPGDLVFTPLWSPGRVERFAFAGMLDIDGDKRSDRELIKEVLGAVGATVETELLDSGERVGNPITERTKFLVIGEVPELASATQDEDRERFRKMAEALKEMRAEARTHGVRIVSLNDFISYIGYKPKRRLFVPGEDKEYRLKSGAASASVNEPGGDMTSSGQTSSAFDRRRGPAQSSSGSTSKVFRGGSGN